MLLSKLHVPSTKKISWNKLNKKLKSIKYKRIMMKIEDNPNIPEIKNKLNASFL